jgi:predicted RNase H-like HicB family nuclease
MTERASMERTVRSELRGGHWVAWVPDANGKPERSIVLVGETREEAEERAREWAAR